MDGSLGCAHHPIDTGRPIFLHGMRRCGSTYVWSRFRAAASTRCFYEPLHEGLSRLTHARIHRDTPDTTRDLRHPALDRPYFAEYAPLVTRRGVAGHHQSFARERVALHAGDKHPRLHAYLNGLIAHARKDGLTPVLGFNGANLRMPWLHGLFRPFSLYVERDPVGIWASYMDHAAKGNFTFIKNIGLALERNRDHPFLAPIAGHALLRTSLLERLRHPKRHYAEAVKAVDPQSLYLMVHYLWLTSLVHAAAHCDLILDLSAAGRDRAVARRVEETVRTATGVGIDLSACVTPAARMTLDDGVRREAEARSLELLPRALMASLRDHLPKADLSLLSEPKRALVELVAVRAMA